ncbi:hypothetical protein [Microbacterium testaceum]|uniref:hypothetical protein n=1 Tax=Microbacterium testaceum TaxID=2033 RepID=UPI0002F3257F|nr:hypothetical protein [Microbacterium testaceum]
MTTLTTPLATAPRALAPTAFDRALLALSRALARFAHGRMEARAARLSTDRARGAARDNGRSLVAEAEFTLRVR